MDKNKRPLVWFTVVAVMLSSLLLVPFVGGIFLNMAKAPSEIAIQRKLAKESEQFSKLQFNLLDPNQAPEGIHDTVMRGYNIMIDTPKNAADYTGDMLSCTNCHFSAGNTTGGKNGSISLAGIAAAYPDYNSRAKSVVTLPERINGCFTRSMNGKPLPLNSPEMVSLVTYLQWISKNFPIYEPIPWRGLKTLKEGYKPNPDNGEKVFMAQCALCHGIDGQGEIRVPPLWGPQSFNDGAGMNKLETLAAFIHANMPYEDPQLTEEEAYDVAAFVKQQPRPKYLEGE